MPRVEGNQAFHGLILTAAALSCTMPGSAAASPLGDALRARIAQQSRAIESTLIAWRRDIHEHPELGNQEHRTSALVAEHLRGLGLRVRTGVARTGVVAVLEGGKPGPVVALRADMDALPVKEAVAKPFASKAKGKYLGQEVDVMHACGHDGHTAILMAVAAILAGLRAELPGTVVFYFQPAEEGPSDFVPDGKNTWGARMMIQEGAMKSPAPHAVFGLHLWTNIPTGRITYRAGATLSSSDDLRIRITGKQTHAGRPWAGTDPIVVSAQVITGLQTIVSRQTDISRAPTVISLGTIHGGTRYNIIPEHVEMTGTIRTYDTVIRRDTHAKVKRTIDNIAAASGATADVQLIEKYDPTVNDPALTARSLPSLLWAAGGDVQEAPLSSGAEDFSFMAQKAPGFFFFLGATPPGQDVIKAAPNHSPLFDIDERALLVGVRALAALATDFLTSTP
jgi:amidohydrolase